MKKDYNIDIVEKWDKVKGKAYVIKDRKGKVISFGKHIGQSKKFYFKKHKKEIVSRNTNRDLAEIIKVQKPKKERIIETKYKKTGKKISIPIKPAKLPVDIPKGAFIPEKKKSWKIKQKKVLKKGDLFQLQAWAKADDGESFFFRSHQYVFDDNSDLMIALDEIKKIIGGSKATFTVQHIYPIVWEPTEYTKQITGYI